MKLLLWLVFLLALSLQVTSKAEAEKRNELEPTTIEPNVGRKVQRPVEAFEKTRDQLSDGLIGLSNRIDRFFSDENIDVEENESQMKLSLEVTVEDNEAPSYDFLVNTYLRLPMTEDSLQVFLTSFNDDDEGDLDDNNNTFGAGLRFEFLERRNINIQGDAGLLLTSRIEPFAKLRVRNSHDFKRWTSRYIQTVYWFDSKGYEFLTQMFWDRKINPILMFRVFTGGKWHEFDDKINFEHNYNLIHTFDRRNAIIYKIGLEGLNQPLMYVENYQFNVTLKTLIYKDWLYLSLAPGMIVRKEDGFQSRAQIKFGLDMIIGSTD